MASLDSIQIRQGLAEGVVVRTATDTGVMIRLRNLTGGAVTSVTVTTATNIVIITANGGTDTYAFATYATLGAVVDAINADGIFQAKILDGLRSDASASTIVTGAVTAGADSNGVTVWDLKEDNSAKLSMTACLSAHRDWDTPSKRVHLQEFRYSVNMGTAAADSAQVWLRKGVVETQLVGLLSVDTTDTTITWANGQGKITSPVDGEIIVRVKDAAALGDSTNYVQATGIVE